MAPGVGKTSLVRRFVESLFDEEYLTTIGVKVDKKLVTVGGREVTLMLWDVAGAEERFSVPGSYMQRRGRLPPGRRRHASGDVDDGVEIVEQM